MNKCPKGSYYCYTDKKCKPIPKGMKTTARFSGGGREPEEVGIDKPLNGGNGNGNGNGNGGGNGGGLGEGSLHKWFKGSKSKDGKGGWVNVVTGGTCASDEPGEGTPKCVSSSKRASMSKSERLSAARRKKKADPGQQQKSGAAKPTYVSTDKPKKKMKEENIIESDKKGKGSGTKDACYHKVKSRYSVWPSAYASGALVKCRKKGAANWGNKTKKEGFTPSQIAALESIGAVELNEKGQKCWKGYEKKGTKKMFGKTYNNCVKKEETNVSIEQTDLSHLDEIVRIQAKTGQILMVVFTWRGKTYATQMFFPQTKKPTKAEILDAIRKVYPGAVLLNAHSSGIDPNRPLIYMNESETSHHDVESVDEKLNLKKAEMGDVVKDFYKSKAPQFKGKTKEKRREMAIAAKLDAEQKESTIRDGETIKETSISDAGTPREISMEAKGASMKCSHNPKGKKCPIHGEDECPALEVDEAAAWTRKAGKNKEGGLNEKGRKSYERENPGSDLKRPSKKVGNPRRKSFCARMKGMKKKLTSSKTASDPNSRINKSLRAWNC